MRSELFLTASLLLAAPAAAQTEDLPNWIWRADDAQVAFQRVVNVGSGLARATFTASCDDQFELRINGGEVLARGDDWREPVEVDVTEALVAGANRVALLGRNEDSHAGLVAWLVLEYEDGRRVEVVTDASWRAAAEVPDDWGAAPADEEAWGAPKVIGALGCWPWHQTAAPPGAGESARALAPEKLELPGGFRAELLYSVPKDQQGSWVSLCEDDQGRFYVSDQGRGLYRLTVPKIGADGEAVVERVAVELDGAQGLEWVDGVLYVVVNAGGGKSGLYRLTDSDGDDALDAVELLRKLEGSGEHGPHAVRLAPDGQGLYVIAGNHTKLPEGISSRPWGEDQLLPRHPDPSGHAAGILAPGGWLCRTDLEGEEWELVAWGMRNAYDFDFTLDGQVLTYDSDMEWDVGTPWYRPTRVLHLVQDADFGWRNGTGKWPDYYPDTLPPVVDIGVGSPTGVLLGASADFPAPWYKMLFVLDWSYGTIWAVQYTRVGESFRATKQPLVRGKPLPVTDAVIARDGAMVFTTGGRGAQSGLYRVYWESDFRPHPGANLTYPPFEPQEPQDKEAKLARAMHRYRLRELRSGDSRPEAAEMVSAVWPALGDSDRFLRHSARTLLEEAGLSGGVGAWRGLLEAEEDPRSVVEACVATARVGNAEDLALILAKLEELPLAELDDEALIGMLRAVGLGFIRLRAPDDAERARVTALFDPLFPSERTEVDIELARMLAYLDAPALPARMVDRMLAAEAPREGLHYAFFLRETPEGWWIDDRRAYFDWLDEVEAASQGGHSFWKYLDDLRGDIWEFMNEEQRALIDPWRRSRSVPDMPKLDVAGRTPQPWKLEELLPSEEELATGRSFDTGRKAFATATCFTCHRIAGQGGATGPDLTGAGSRYSARDLLESLLEPSKVVSDQYRDTEVLLNDDELLVGRLLEQTDEWIAILTLPPDEAVIEVDRPEIASMRPHPLSRMPEGLLDTLTRDEVLDLLAYLIAGGDPNAPAFAD